MNDLNIEMPELSPIAQVFTGQSEEEKWLLERLKNFTGSRFKDLMGTSRATSKAPWGDMAKTYDFGEKCIRYCWQIYNERKNPRLLPQVTAKSMDWGKENEPLVLEHVRDKYGIDFKDTGLIPVNGHLGVTPDGFAELESICCEVKSTVSWDGHYKRMAAPVCDKHNDFWQLQGELLATKAKENWFIVTEPHSSELYDIQKIKPSEIHLNCLQERAKFLSECINLALQQNIRFVCEFEEIIKEHLHTV